MVDEERGELVPQDPNDEPAAVMVERERVEQASGANGALARKGRRGRPCGATQQRRRRR